MVKPSDFKISVILIIQSKQTNSLSKHNYSLFYFTNKLLIIYSFTLRKLSYNLKTVL